MKEPNLTQRIRDAVNSGMVKEQFKSKDFSFLSKSPGFIAKHSVGNGQYSEHFIRVERGLYKLKIEPFRKGDFIRIKDITKYHINRIQGSKVNIFTIREIKSSFIEIFECKQPIPMSDIEPIPINGKDDLNIYYDPIIAAATIGYNEPSPIFRTDYSYYHDAFKKYFYKGKNFQEIVKENGCKYVHEVQHYLDDEFHDKELKIDTY